ncbi:hypothetical protein BJV78DRAFT_1189944 [Lactifluus subvellereus]|nr:hypothetical protein BJV78DRAFT_1189944 [Lactifluus subvellereus]
MSLPVPSSTVQPTTTTTTTTISSPVATISAPPSTSSTTTPILVTSSPTTVAVVTPAPSSSSPFTTPLPSTTTSASVPTTTTASVATPAPISTTTASPARLPSARTSATFVIQTSDNGQVFTQTSIITISGSAPTESSAAQSSSSPTGFFHNTGAVAGVFSVAGIISLILVFLLFTSFIRRRRARKFDREIDEAAAEAATAKPPDFDDFDFTSSGTALGYGHFSDTSHGTYSQPPLSHEQPHPYPGVGPAGPGAAGIGARGRSLRNGGQPDPFGALAHPLEQYEMQDTRRSWHQGNPRGGAGVLSYDLVHAAGLAGGDPYAVTRGASTNSGFSHSQSGMSGLARSLSQGASILPTTAESYPMPTPAPGYPGGQDTPPEKARYSALFTPGGGVSTMPPDGDEDVYGGYQDQQPAGLDSPQSPGLAGPRAHEGEDEGLGEKYTPGSYPHEQEEAARTSFADDEDYGYNSGQRVLRVRPVPSLF